MLLECYLEILLVFVMVEEESNHIYEECANELPELGVQQYTAPRNETPQSA